MFGVGTVGPCTRRAASRSTVLSGSSTSPTSHPRSTSRTPARSSNPSSTCHEEQQSTSEQSRPVLPNLSVGRDLQRSPETRARRRPAGLTELDQDTVTAQPKSAASAPTRALPMPILCRPIVSTACCSARRALTTICFAVPRPAERSRGHRHPTNDAPIAASRARWGAGQLGTQASSSGSSLGATEQRSRRGCYETLRPWRR